MCGIVGYVGPRDAPPILVSGLRKLEYRGYDSAGLATITDHHVEVRRCVGKLDNLDALLREQPLARHAGHRAHALGDARPTVGAERPPAPRRQGGRDPQRHHRELPRAARTRWRSAAAPWRRRPTPRSSRTSSTSSWQQGCGLAEATRAAIARARRARSPSSCCRESEPDRLVAAKSATPIVIGLGDGRELRRLRHPGDARPHAPRALPRGRRDGRGDAPTRSRITTFDGDAGRARAARWSPGTR